MQILYILTHLSQRSIQGLTIVHYEIVNFVIALRLWGKFWRHSRAHILSNNLEVVQVVNSGKTKDMFLATYVRKIWCQK